MKKILLSILLILLVLLAYIVYAKGINIGSISIGSMNMIKTASSNLDSNINIANELVNITYLEEIEKLQTAITNLKTSKQDYENKNLYANENTALTTVQIKTYTIHYLWTILGNYKKDKGVKSLNLDLKATQVSDVYNLEFTLVGTYISITDFLYEIENDEELNFEIQNLKISSGVTNTTSTTDDDTQVDTTVAASDGTIIQATFTVADVGITLE